MNDKELVVNPFASIGDAIAAKEAATGERIIKNTAMQTRQAITLHKKRSDQDILVKFYGSFDLMDGLVPRTVWHENVIDQEAVNGIHAGIAQALGKNEKSVEGRVREGAVDTADFKMEAKGCLRAGRLFSSLKEEGYVVLQIKSFRKVRSVAEKARLATQFGADKVGDQIVLEIRLVHKSKFEGGPFSFKDMVEAFSKNGQRGLRPSPPFMRKIKSLVCPVTWGACTVFSNNTATLDPTITINFRNSPNPHKDTEELAVEAGKLLWKQAY